MTLEERVKRLESLMTTSSQPEAVSLHTAIRRDLAAEEAAPKVATAPPLPHESPFAQDIRDAHAALDLMLVPGRCVMTVPQRIAALRERLAAEEASTLDEAASLRAQVADLTREVDAWKVKHAGAETRARLLFDAKNAAIARAEKAERWRDEAQRAKYGTPCRCESWIEEARISEERAIKAESALTARDATIAEARKRISEIASWLRDNGHNWPWPEGHSSICFCCVQVRECDAWLAGQPAPAAKPTTVALEVHEAMIGELRNLRAEIARLTDENMQLANYEEAYRETEMQRDTARAEVARLEGLCKRCEVWFTWWMDDRRAFNHPEESSAILADLRAGRAG